MKACPNCGFHNTDGRSVCKQCHQSMSSVAGSDPPLPQVVQPSQPQADLDPAPPPTSMPPPIIPTPTVAPKKPGLWIKIGLGMGAFVVGCCVLLIIIGTFAPSPQNTASAPTPDIAKAIEADPTKAIVKVVEVAPTEVPTNTPEPTATARPTRTPRPTEEPATATPQSVLTAAETAYVALVTTQISEIGSALVKVSELAQAYDTSDDWKIQMAVQVVRIQTAHVAVTKLTPPRRFRDFHALLLDATSDCNQAMDKMVSGIDKNRARDITEAGVLMESCGAKTKPALDELQRLQQP